MGKRTRQYKKLMQQYELAGFRAPYQLLLTSDLMLDTLKLDLVALFEKTLSAKHIKPMITQCCIRALYERNSPPGRDPAVVRAIELAKTFERRRCGHLPTDTRLSEHDCVVSVVDHKGRGENKFRYVVATQDEALRERLRSVVPTPLVYVRRSVMILEPMSAATAMVRSRDERVKFRAGILGRPQKRKRDEEDPSGEGEGHEDGAGREQRNERGQGEEDEEEPPKKKKKKTYGKKGPNPLSVKKPRKKAADTSMVAAATVSTPAQPPRGQHKQQGEKTRESKLASSKTDQGSAATTGHGSKHRKRRKKIPAESGDAAKGDAPGEGSDAGGGGGDIGTSENAVETSL